MDKYILVFEEKVGLEYYSPNRTEVVVIEANSADEARAELMERNSDVIIIIAIYKLADGIDLA